MHGISAFLALSNAVAACGPQYPDLASAGHFGGSVQRHGQGARIGAHEF